MTKDNQEIADSLLDQTEDRRVKKNKAEITALCQVAYVLRTIPRKGHEKDFPEGSRYIQMSDTMANEMALVIDKEVCDAAAKRPQSEGGESEHPNGEDGREATGSSGGDCPDQSRAVEQAEEG